jgi:hypothetical protein
MQSVPTNVWEWLDKIRPDDRMPIVIVSILFGLTALVFILWIFIHAVSTIHRTRAESNLKHELLERGLSADEIAMIVASTTNRHGDKTPPIRRG